jgi:hypothetical protein
LGLRAFSANVGIGAAPCSSDLVYELFTGRLGFRGEVVFLEEKGSGTAFTGLSLSP